LEQESQQLQARAEWEHDVLSQQNRQRCQILSKLAAWDEAKAKIYWMNVERDQESRVARANHGQPHTGHGTIAEESFPWIESRRKRAEDNKIF
jgi:hypothetical protein